jgi:hypothetical protein
MGQLSPTGFLPAGCHGWRFYLSSGKPMGQLSPMGFLPAGCHGLKFYMSSGKPMGQLSPMGFLPAGCHGAKLSIELYSCLRVSMNVRWFTCPKRSPCGSFYLTSGLPIAMD